MFDVVCADCGINVPWEDQYGVPGDNNETNIVCPECAKKYGFNLNEQENRIHNENERDNKIQNK